MLQRLRTVKTGNRHQDDFLARDDMVLKWARQLSANRPWQAEDLAQDAYLQFMAIRPDLDSIRNLDAYLYAIVRNLHRSMLHRHLRLRQVPLSILDFDRAEDGLKRIEKEHEQDVLEDLEAIRAFACERREASKIGSLLILRFFYGYGVEETARLMGVSRVALDSRLLRARKEAREYLTDQRTRSAGRMSQRASEASSAAGKETIFADRSSDPITVLRDRIFESGSGNCISSAELKALYASPPSQGIDNKLLAHIVCCRVCLNHAVRHAGVASIEQEPPDDPAAGPAATHQSTSRDEKLRKVREWDRQFKRLLEHRPQELRITVNGMPLASQPVVAERGDLTISVLLAERIEFIEVLSEQEVRLLMLPVLATPPEGDYEQTGRLDFGDGRVLSIRVTFGDLWPTVHVQYGQLLRIAAIETMAREAIIGSLPAERREPAGQETGRGDRWWLLHPASWWSPRRLGGVLAVLLIVLLLFVQTHQNTASAAALVGQMEEWQRGAAASGAVLHRSFEFAERDKRTGGVTQRRVEVWRRSSDGVKIGKLVDHSGAVIASARTFSPPLPFTVANAWQFEPAPETYRALAGDLGAVRVKSESHDFELAGPAIRLKLDRATWAPIEETIDTAEKVFEFRERLTESEPEHLTPFATDLPRSRGQVQRPNLTSARMERQQLPVAIPDIELDSAEISARTALHRLNADLGEQLRVHRREQEIEVAGIVDSAQRKNDIEEALKGFAHVRVSLLSSDDIAGSPDETARTLAALQSTPLLLSK